MKTYLAAFVIAVVVTCLVTPVVRRLAPKLGAVDLPSGRRVNKVVVPRLGGLAIAAGFLAPILGLLVYDNKISLAFRENPSRAVALIAGALVMTALGAVDDMRGVRVRTKVIVQVAVAVAAYLSGFRIDAITLPVVGQIEMGIFALPLTVLWIVGIVNAINLIDGLDGLAAGVAFFVCMVNMVAAILSQEVLVVLLSVALGGSLLAFLVFNFNPAKIFMGDSGSMFVGFVLGTTSLLGAKGSTAVALLVPVLALGLPIIDTSLAVLRRVLERRPIFSPDRGHIHHRLLELGLTQRKAVLVLYGVSVVFTAAAIGVYLGKDWEVGVALLVASLLAVGLMRAVGLFQFRSIRRAQREGLRESDTDRIRRALPRYIEEVARAARDQDLAEALTRFGEAAGLLLIDCRAAKIEVLCEHVFEAEANGAGSTRGYVSASYPISIGNGDSGRIKFGWFSESGDVSPQNDVLLELAAEQIGAWASRSEDAKRRRTGGGSDVVV